MRKTRTERTESPLVPATASSKGLGYLRVGSVQSRAAARALVAARQESEAEEEWDREMDCSGLAERFRIARERAEGGEAPERNWAPICIPPGKENTVRGRLAARINESRVRVARFDIERKAE